jgi:hypothetical protein
VIQQKLSVVEGLMRLLHQGLNFVGAVGHIWTPSDRTFSTNE